VKTRYLLLTLMMCFALIMVFKYVVVFAILILLILLWRARKSAVKLLQRVSK
jgi:4-amino-4-deoxy-L-arabinose transferase-like glycosyltransferase